MNKTKMKDSGAAGGGAVYCLGIIGALVYYFQNAETFMQFVAGLFQALFWPAFLIYESLKYLGA